MRRNKFNNTKTVLDGIKFDSGAEARRYAELKLLQLAGRISELEVQPKFQIAPSVKWEGKTMRARFYIADFRYKKNGKKIVEDKKSEITKKNPTYTLKRHFFLLQYGSEYVFRET